MPSVGVRGAKIATVGKRYEKRKRWKRGVNGLWLIRGRGILTLGNRGVGVGVVVEFYFNITPATVWFSRAPVASRFPEYLLQCVQGIITSLSLSLSPFCCIHIYHY